MMTLLTLVRQLLGVILARFSQGLLRVAFGLSQWSLWLMDQDDLARHLSQMRADILARQSRGHQ